MRVDFIINIAAVRHLNSIYVADRRSAAWRAKNRGTACSVKPEKAGASLLKNILHMADPVSQKVADAAFRFVRLLLRMR
jgi:hypothetical protein